MKYNKWEIRGKNDYACLLLFSLEIEYKGKKWIKTMNLSSIIGKRICNFVT